MKNSALLKKAEGYLSFCEAMISKSIKNRKLKDAFEWYQNLAGALDMMHWMDLISEEARKARADPAFERCLAAMRAGMQEKTV